MHMKSLKMECIRTATTTKNQHSYQEPPDYIDHKIIEKLKGEYIVKTLLCTIQHCLSFPNQSKKTYSFEKSNPLELSRAADEAFVICRFVNPHCSHGLFTTSSNAELPHDPCYDVICKTDAKTKFQLLSFTSHLLEHIIHHDLFQILANCSPKVLWLCN